jgi:hypothetical protein
MKLHTCVNLQTVQAFSSKTAEAVELGSQTAPTSVKMAVECSLLDFLQCKGDEIAKSIQSKSAN